MEVSEGLTKVAEVAGPWVVPFCKVVDVVKLGVSRDVVLELELNELVEDVWNPEIATELLDESWKLVLI